MLKMFSTQLSGLFKRLQEKEEFSIEDGARLLAQAAAGEGIIYLYGAGEMGAIPLEAIHGVEPLKGAALLQLEQASEVTSADRVLIVTRHSNDPEAVKLAQELTDSGHSFVAISTAVSNDDSPGLDTLADVHIDLKITKGMLPDEFGNRFGQPTSMAALFIYYGLKFTIDEIMTEYED
ncbi:DUF2529 domain-containing protein [Mesobacillus maritimus]|uniref:DUF2529 domain-containing protein n=1 Tax=Mesobacillus maritimus TaxID=1643336 RepID=A0ABS7K591_9BACI|nr:DUF2529 domain-containing protein [Mesobacillus maritimus]MBY0097434.1 DUF2529 domain-containing protein [Mesobacillus maritimus]